MGKRRNYYYIPPEYHREISFQKYIKKNKIFFRDATKLFKGYGYVVTEEHKNYTAFSKDGITFYLPRIQEYFTWVFTEHKDFIFEDLYGEWSVKRLKFNLDRMSMFKYRIKYNKEFGLCK